MKMNKLSTTGSMLIGAGLTAAAMFAAPAIKNMTSTKTLKNLMSNDSNSNSSETLDKLSMH